MMSHRGRLTLLLLAASLVLLIGLGAVLMPRLARRKALAAETVAEASRPPIVRVARVQRAAESAELELSADLQALVESPIQARVEGYVRSRIAEFGSFVKKGELMAELETPDLDQQIRQAQASLSQAVAAKKQMEAQIGQADANLKLAKITASRWNELQKEGVVSSQDADEKQAQYDVSIAALDAAKANLAAAVENINAMQANLSRLDEMKSFARLTAPFAGIVTWRNPDIGVLISPGGGGKEMFRVADIHIIRAFTSIPQSHVPFINAGVPTVLTVQDIPGRVWRAPVSTIAYGLDPSTRTMLALVNIENPDLALKPGMYSRIRFLIPSPPKSLMIPGDAVIGRNDGNYVAVVDGAHKVHYSKVDIARDFGPTVAIASGLSEGDLVVLSPSDEVREGAAVELRSSPTRER